MKEITIDIIRETEELLNQGYPRERIEDSLAEMGYSSEQINQIFKVIERKKEEEKAEKQKRRMILIAAIIILFVIMLAIIGLMSS
ncbi:MAG: hypothetical protein J7K68_05030 [Candidatus Diapherotrites archaeon]|nr:hypothetical protein [Candidatus Diapherotrites archaeon]